MNNKGEVVGKSLVHMVYKNKIHKCFHATMWVNGEALDLHDEMPKSKESHIFAINDSREMLAQSSSGGYSYISNVDKTDVPSCFTVSQRSHYSSDSKINNKGLVVYAGRFVLENKEDRFLIHAGEITDKMTRDRNESFFC